MRRESTRKDEKPGVFALARASRLTVAEISSRLLTRPRVSVTHTHMRMIFSCISHFCSKSFCNRIAIIYPRSVITELLARQISRNRSYSYNRVACGIHDAHAHKLSSRAAATCESSQMRRT